MITIALAISNFCKRKTSYDFRSFVVHDRCSAARASQNIGTQQKAELSVH